MEFQRIQLLKVYSPGFDYVHFVQVTDSSTFQEISDTIQAKKIVAPGVKFTIAFSNVEGKEIEPAAAISYGFYQPKEVFVNVSNHQDLQVPKSSQHSSSPGAQGRKLNVIGPVPQEFKMGVSEFPVTVSHSQKESSDLSNLALADSNSISLSGASLNEAIDGADKDKKRSMPSMPSRLNEDIAPETDDEEIASVTESMSNLATDPNAPPGPGALRKRLSSLASNGSRPTLKRNLLKGRNSAIASNGSLPRMDTPGDSILVRVLLEKDAIVTQRIGLYCVMEDLLRNVCVKLGLSFEEYTLELPGKEKVELDRMLQHYHSLNKASEVYLVKSPKVYHLLSVLENGEEVVVMQSSSSGDMLVMAATPERLLQVATDDSQKDNTFIDTLLLTFRSFMRPVDFFDGLIDRFNASPPAEASPEDMAYYQKMIQIVQTKTMTILNHWISHYWHDFSHDLVLKKSLGEFLEALKATHMATQSRELIHKIEIQSEKEEALQQQRKNIDVKKKAMESMIEEFEAPVLAKQLALHDFEVFQQINPIEYLNLIWKKKDSDPSEWATPNLDFFSARFDMESYWAATEILREADLKKRAKILQKFIQLAKECQMIKNFFSMFALFSGLSMAPITRLKKTWELIPAKVKQTFDEIEKFCDPSKNMKNFRDLLSHSPPPIIPFLPIYMKDLTFMNDGNQAFFKNMVNFDKLRMMGDKVKEVHSLGFIPFPFEKDVICQNWLHKPKIETSSAKLKEESLAREPQ